MRHIYDLHAIREYYDIREVSALAREIMKADAETYGHQFPAYRNDPVAETLRALEGIAVSGEFASAYSRFQRDMVYGMALDFESATATLKALAEPLDKA